METVKQQEKKATTVAPTNKVITLPSGAVATKTPFKGKHVREAAKLSGGDQIKGVFAIIAITCLIDGNKITIEELDEMDGADVLTLMGEFEGLF